MPPFLDTGAHSPDRTCLCLRLRHRSPLRTSPPPRAAALLRRQVCLIHTPASSSAPPLILFLPAPSMRVCELCMCTWAPNWWGLHIFNLWPFAKVHMAIRFVIGSMQLTFTSLPSYLHHHDYRSPLILSCHRMRVLRHCRPIAVSERGAFICISLWGLKFREMAPLPSMLVPKGAAANPHPRRCCCCCRGLACTRHG
ncbi:hypothetical protein BS78_05G190900 [Paspalum vaginatum]|nr:hypothetical protein BS78_05G190900 [Paspalum vaginatum]